MAKPTPAPIDSSSVHTQAMLVILCLEFAITGFLIALPGPILPLLAQKWKLSDAQAGSIFFAQFLGNVLGALFANWSFRSSLLVGLAMISTGASGFAFLNWPTLRACFFICGVGLGLCIPATNLTVARLSSLRPAASLNLLNAVWGVGAICCPGMVFVAQRFARIEALLAVLSGTAAFLFILLLLLRHPILKEKKVSAQERTSSSALLLAFALVFFLYVGTEACIAGWISVYGQRLFPEFHLPSFSLVTCFWGTLVLGRAASIYALRAMGERRLYFSSLALACIGFITLLSGRSLAIVASGTLLCGLALGPVFPLLLASSAELLMSKRHSGWVFACGALGGAILPWGTGQISTAYSTLHAGLMVPFAAMLALLAGYWLVPTPFPKLDEIA